MFAETLGMLPRLATAQPAHAVAIARDVYAVGADAQRCSFEVVLTRPAVSISADALLQVAHASTLLNCSLCAAVFLASSLKVGAFACAHAQTRGCSNISGGRTRLRRRACLCFYCRAGSTAEICFSSCTI